MQRKTLAALFVAAALILTAAQCAKSRSGSVVISDSLPTPAQTSIAPTEPMDVRAPFLFNPLNTETYVRIVDNAWHDAARSFRRFRPTSTPRRTRTCVIPE